MKKQGLIIIFRAVAALASIIGCFLYFRYVVPYHVCFKEQLQMFVFSSSYLWSYFSKPASLACLVGDFLTQFLFFKTSGAAVITLLLSMLWLLFFFTLKQFSQKRNDACCLLSFAAMPPVMVDWILYPELSFTLSLSVSFIIILSAFLLYSKTNGKISSATAILLIPALYMIAGASVFLFVVVAILYDIYCCRRRFVLWTAITSLSIVIPVIFRHSYLLTLKQAFSYPYTDIKQGLSICVLTIIILLFVCFKNIKFKTCNFKYKTLTVFVIFSLFILVLFKPTKKEQEKLFGIVIEAGHENWDAILEIAESVELKNHVAASYTNLALSHKNLLGERLMDFYQPFTLGLIHATIPSSNWFTLFSGNDAYFHVGDMEMAQHAAMVGMLCTPQQRSARLVKRMAEINLAIGDMPAATKYIRMIEATLFYKIDVANTSYRAGIFKEDIIRRSDDIKLSLELLVKSDPNNLPALNYLLCLYLLNKDISAFRKAYTSYWFGKIDYIPKVYAQALLIYFAGTNSTMKEVGEYGINPELIKSFGEYTSLFEQSEGDLNLMLKKFHNTYWLYFHFAVLNN